MFRWIILVLICQLAPFFSASAQQDSPLLPPDGTSRRLRLPILMYHYISPIPPGADDFRRELTVEPDIFATHLRYLHEAGFETVSLNDLYNALNAGQSLPQKPIILTFDDGHRDHYDHALPLLIEYGFQATFFIITGLADEGNPAHLSWEQISAMDVAGMEMESHSKHHHDLRNRSSDFLVYELLGSYQSLEAHLGEPPTSFSYPSGFYDATAIEVVQSVPYSIAVTTEPGNRHTMDDILTLRRIRIYGNMPVENLAVALASN
ncbi:MAG: polysaccharide deacetylase family protein [Chloroflexi bacterium]|nr:polysaccharide deacetylase family protein [Chloroflexota bacterium]